MKKLVSLLAAILVLALPLINAWAELSPNTNAEGLPIVKEKETFQIYTYRQVLDLSDSYNDKIAEKTAEERTNIHIDWSKST